MSVQLCQVLGEGEVPIASSLKKEKLCWHSSIRDHSLKTLQAVLEQVKRGGSKTSSNSCCRLPGLLGSFELFLL